MRIIWRDCEHCGREFSQPDDPGRKRRFCADACKQAAYRARKRHADQARRRAEEEAARRAREERRRRDEQARQRQRAHRTPPHAARSRSSRALSTLDSTRHAVGSDATAPNRPG
jgi:membrane protein involved in colicin uptake